MGGGELASETIISYFRRVVIPVLPDPMVLLFRDCMTNKLVGIICFFVGNIEALHPIIFHLIHCYLNIPFHPRKLACTHTHHYLQHFATWTQKAKVYYLDITLFFAMLLKHLSSPHKKYLRIPCHPTIIFHMQSIPHSNKTNNIKWHHSQTQKSKQYFFTKRQMKNRKTINKTSALSQKNIVNSKNCFPIS